MVLEWGIPLLSSFVFHLHNIFSKKLINQGETHYNLLVYTALATSLISAPLITHFPIPNLQESLYLLIAALSFLGGNYALQQAIQHSQLNTLIPLQLILNIAKYVMYLCCDYIWLQPLQPERILAMLIALCALQRLLYYTNQNRQKQPLPVSIG